MTSPNNVQWYFVDSIPCHRSMAGSNRNGLGFLAGESLSTMSNVAAGYLLSAVYDVDLHARFWLRRQKTDDMKEIFFLHGGDLAWS